MTANPDLQTEEEPPKIHEASPDIVKAIYDAKVRPTLRDANLPDAWVELFSSGAAVHRWSQFTSGVKEA